MKNKKIIYDVLISALGSFLYSIGIVCFAVPADFAPGGVTGIAVVISHLAPIPIGILIIILNIPIILMTYKLLGKKFIATSLVAMAFISFFTDFLFLPIPVYEGNRLISSIFAGVLVGAGLALLYSRNTSSGGADFVVLAFRKIKPHMSLGQIVLMIDIIVVLLGAVVFREVESVLYGAIYLFVSAETIDRIIVGFSRTKLAMCITSKPKEVASKIDEYIGRGSTIIDAKGGFKGDECFVVMSTCSNHQYAKLKAAVMDADDTAFVIIADAGSVYGEGFHPLDL